MTNSVAPLFKNAYATVKTESFEGRRKALRAAIAEAKKAMPKCPPGTPPRFCSRSPPARARRAQPQGPPWQLPTTPHLPHAQTLVLTLAAGDAEGRVTLRIAQRDHAPVTVVVPDRADQKTDGQADATILRICRRAGLPKEGFHRRRHSFGTRAGRESPRPGAGRTGRDRAGRAGRGEHRERAG